MPKYNPHYNTGRLNLPRITPVDFGKKIDRAVNDHNAPWLSIPRVTAPTIGKYIPRLQ